MTVRTLYLNQIQEVTQVSIGKAKQLMETCIWCLTASRHTNGVRMKVIEESLSNSYTLMWRDAEVDLAATQRSFNQDDATEGGAEAIALLLAIERTEYNAVQRAVTTTGIDYCWVIEIILTTPSSRRGAWK